MSGRWASWAEREPLLIRSEQGKVVAASGAGSDAWLARRQGVWARLAQRIRKVEQ